MLKSISLRLCTLIVLLFAGIYSFAQQVQVKGTVVEKSSGESIIGASVMEVGPTVMEQLRILTEISLCL